ncbi:peptide deformylase [Pontibacter pamirensis]|uniref:peptide deformylase n=1 Tax=Pontibacter pamirensis TaxID=2562824 RepID=UPI001389A21F|nr:peptide deformylase [Pontibacter pamirensis]
MIYPITAYGDPILKDEAEDIPRDYPDLKELIEDMYSTMYFAHGVGLAAPQISKSIRLFVIDSEPMMDEKDKGKGVKKAFINPEIVEEDGEEWGFEEGCLSIPGVREVVYRPERIVIRYFDEEWNEHEDSYDGMNARVIQHEYDHIEGILFTDHLNGLKKRLIKNRLAKISKGDVDADYKMKFPALSKRR